MNEYIQRLNMVVNTLNAATLRADQLDAIQRIQACTAELRGVMADLRKQDEANRTDDKEG